MPSHRHGFTRRRFLLGATAGLVAGGSLGWLGGRLLPRDGSPFAGKTQEVKHPDYAMPGRFPGRVVEVLHADSVRPDHTINREAVKTMLARGMKEFTGADDAHEAWASFFQKGDVVGIKVNPVGRKPKPGEPGRVAGAVGSISNPELVLEIVTALRAVGVNPRDIIIFERYANEFVDAGYEKMMREREMDGCRWYASASSYSNEQVDISGFDGGRDSVSWELARHVTGYDRDHYVHMGFCNPDMDSKDDRRFRTHLSVIISRMIDKLITIPVLKDHRSGGVTLSLKNLSHGMNNNVARSHLGTTAHGGKVGSAYPEGPNQCNTFIPTAVAQAKTREKATLHIMDGLIGVYEGGPGSWNKTWGTWHHKGLFFATDPVAMDHVGWDIIDDKRAEEGWAPVGHMGMVTQTDEAKIARQLATLAAGSPFEALQLAVSAKNRQDGLASENFNTRQPEHVILAGALGLGVFDMKNIEHRRIRLS